MSTFTWIDHSEKQRRQMLDAVELFREKDTRDELGLSGIRDTFSDLLFPGTGALQTRARYFFFIPWLYRRLEADRVPSSEVVRKLRAMEITLIDRLAKTSDFGVIGIVARQNLQRTPSSIYWNGLKVLRICLFPGSQAEYHRGLDRYYAAGQALRNDDDEIIGGPMGNWHKKMPLAPKDFMEQTALGLTEPEAQYLSDRIVETHRESLFAHLLDDGYKDADVSFVWENDATAGVTPALARQLAHARCFSEVMNGAAILYNLYLAEMEPKRDDVIEKCEGLYAEWAGMMADRRSALQIWDRSDFWMLLGEQGFSPRGGTQLFVDDWCDRAIRTEAVDLRKSAGTVKLIFDREKAIKKGLARSLPNSANRAMWKGEAGLGQMDFRWSSARVILNDIANGLDTAHA